MRNQNKRFMNQARTTKHGIREISTTSTDVPLLYPLRISENLQFFVVFMGYRSRTLAENEPS